MLALLFFASFYCSYQLLKTIPIHCRLRSPKDFPRLSEEMWKNLGVFLVVRTFPRLRTYHFSSSLRRVVTWTATQDHTFHLPRPTASPDEPTGGRQWDILYDTGSLIRDDVTISYMVPTLTSVGGTQPTPTALLRDSADVLTPWKSVSIGYGSRMATLELRYDIDTLLWLMDENLSSSAGIEVLVNDRILTPTSEELSERTRFCRRNIVVCAGSGLHPAYLIPAGTRFVTLKAVDGSCA